MQHSFQRFVVAVAAILVPSAVFAVTAPVRVLTQDVGELLRTLKITQTAYNLRAMDTDATLTHFAFLFDDGKVARIFRDGDQIYIGPSSKCTQDPYLFWMTKDAHIVSVPDCKTLYIDDYLVSVNNTVLTAGKESAVYLQGKLYYPDQTAVYRYDITSGELSSLYGSQNENIQYLRVVGDNVVYTTQNPSTGVFSIYKNGEKLSSVSIDNPANFLVTQSGDVYYFVRQGSRYVLNKNKGKYFTGAGLGGFIFEDDKHAVWHVSFVDGATPADVRISLFKGASKANLFPANIGNAEGFMAFNNGQYAVRAKKRDRTWDFYLLKNGKYLGGVFTFEPGHKDYNGLFFAKSGKVYMRNFSADRWSAYEDGKTILGDVFRNVWLVRANPAGDVVVFGTK